MANKTTRLGDGEVGIEEGLSSLGNDMNVEVSRNNYRLSNSGEFAKFKEVVYAMVSRWSPEDQLRVIKEYGDYDFLRSAKRNRKGQLNPEQLTSQCAETLIIRLHKSELRKLVRQEVAAEGRLSNLVKQNNTNAKRFASSIMSAQTFETVYSVAKYSTKSKQIMKMVKDVDPSYKINRRIIKSFDKLRKELDELLSGYTPIDLAVLGTQIGTNFSDNTSEKNLKRMIINRCIMYVALILGKVGGKKKEVNISRTFDPNEVQYIEELISMTSYATVVGSPGLSNALIKAKRDKLKSAKKQLENKTNLIKQTTGNPFIRLQRKFINNKWDTPENWMAAASEGKLASEFSSIDTIDKLHKRAYELGLNPDGYKNTTQLIFDMNRRIKVLNKNFIKLSSKRKLSDAEKTVQSDLWEKMGYNSNFGGTKSSSNVPYVEFNDNGDLLNTSIKSAVPVLIVGSYKTGTFSDGNGSLLKAFQNASDDEVKSYEEELQDLIEKKQKHFWSYDSKYDNKKWQEKKIAKHMEKFNKQNLLNISNSYQPFLGKVEPMNRLSFGITPGMLSSPDLLSSVEISKIQKILQYHKDDAVTRDDRVRGGEGSYRKKLVDKGFKHAQYLSKAILDVGYRTIEKPKPLKAVYIANKDYERMPLYVMDNRNHTERIDSFLHTQLPILFGGLQNVGTTINGASAAALAVGASSAIVSSILETINGKINSASAYATGGTGEPIKFASGGRAHAYRDSTFITGDSLDGKPNEEMVNIDWNNKKFYVKPIQRENNSGVSNVTRMSSAERSAPMSVALTTQLVKYNNTLIGASDDGNNTAIKVYSVNGLNEPIIVDGVEISVASIIGGMYSKLGSIETISASGVQLLANIANNTKKTASNTTPKASTITSSFGGFPETLESIAQGK